MPVGIKLDLQRLLNGIQFSVLDLADAPGHGAVETGSVFQQIAHHGSLALGRQLDQFLINRPVGVHPVIVIGVDDAEGSVHLRLRAQQGVDRAEGLGASLRNVIEVRYGGIVLIDVGHLHRLALRRLFLLEIAHQLVHHLPHFRLDDEHHLVKASPQGIVNGILHQNFAVGADAVHLLAAAIPGTEACRHDHQRNSHIASPLFLLSIRYLARRHCRRSIFSSTIPYFLNFCNGLDRFVFPVII